MAKIMKSKPKETHFDRGILKKLSKDLDEEIESFLSILENMDPTEEQLQYIHTQIDNLRRARFRK